MLCGVYLNIDFRAELKNLFRNRFFDSFSNLSPKFKFEMKLSN